MPALSLVRQTNARFQPKYTPVAIFVGGTSGIGRGMAEVFGRYTQGKSDIVIVGRNKEAADEVFSKLPSQTSQTYKREFFRCDVTRMKNVEVATKEILNRYSKINFLILSPGFLSMKGRDETEEGLDTKLAVHYYSRWKFIKDLLPALNKASEEGEDAKVFSVLAPGKGGEIDLDDLGLKNTFSVIKAALQAPTYNDLMMEVRFRVLPSFG
jgi:NAD(P)-dependent dehydrogenase (short-subunit alcohol dehydrogenase family)